MSADTLIRIPALLRAGDTITWRRCLADYPASAGWQLQVTLVGSTAVYSANSVADGDDHVFTLAAAETALWEPGGYQAVETATKAAERFSLYSMRVTVQPDLAAAVAGLDTRSHARKVLDNINAWLESKSVTAGETQIGERRVRNYDIAELLALRDRYAALVRSEDAAASGGRTGRLLVRF